MTNLWARQNKTVNKHCNIKPSTKRKPSRFFCTKMHQNLNYCQFIFNILYFYMFYKEQNKFSWIGTISLLFGYFTLLKTCFNRFFLHKTLMCKWYMFNFSTIDIFWLKLHVSETRYKHSKHKTSLAHCNPTFFYSYLRI